MVLVCFYSGQLSLRGIRFTNFILAIGVSFVFIAASYSVEKLCPDII